MFKKDQRQPTEKERNLIADLRTLKNADGIITVVASEPVGLVITNADFQTAEAIPLTERDKNLLSLLRFMNYGDFYVHILDGQWDQVIDSRNTFRKKY